MEIMQAATDDEKVLLIFSDEDPMNPRENDNFGTMVTWHRRYSIGERANSIEPADFDAEAKEGKYIMLPLYMLDHSGTTIRTTDFGDPWDSGQLGFIYVTPAQVRENWGVRRITAKVRAQAIALLEAEVKEYDLYQRGAGFGYITGVVDKDALESEGVESITDIPMNDWDQFIDQDDSCFGFLSDDPREALKGELPDEFSGLLLELRDAYSHRYY